MAKPSFGERALFLIAPNAGQRRYEERINKERQTERAKETKTGPVKMATGYGNHGASRTLNSMIGWLAGGGSATEDVDLHGALLRKRSRDLYMGGGLARSGITSLSTSVVGWGIQPKPKIDGETLGMTDDEADAWERKTLKEFSVWAESPFCDGEREKDFYALQELAFLSMLMSGDAFVIFGNRENKANPYTTTLRVLEADRVETPDSAWGESTVTVEQERRIVDGVEISPTGEVIRYWITNHHPLQEQTMDALAWVPIEAFGKETGMPNILHITTWERPEQRRGIPFVASQIEQIKQLDRYMNAELAAQVVSAMLTTFIESKEDDGIIGVQDAVNEDEKVTDDEMQIELAPGAVYDLPPGKSISTVNPIRQTGGPFEAFINALITNIGAGMEIPKEVLIKKYESNYTAARGAILDFWRTVRKYRSRFVKQFAQPVYEAWLTEAVAQGRVEAPGFFEDAAIRRAWCGCKWLGSSMGHIDPKKEVEAAAMRVAMNMTTQEQEAGEYNGNDWADNVRQRKKENAAIQKENTEQEAGK